MIADINKNAFKEFSALEAKGFLNDVTAVSKELNILPEWLLTCMWIESHWNPKARNASTGATGLIQVMPATAKDLNTSTNAISLMGRNEQLNKIVLPYFKSSKGKLKSLYDVYFKIFYPNAIGKSDSFVIGNEKSKDFAHKVGLQNSGYDFNKDGLITKGEVKLFLEKTYFYLFPLQAVKLHGKFLRMNRHFKK